MGAVLIFVRGISSGHVEVGPPGRSAPTMCRATGEGEKKKRVHKVNALFCVLVLAG